jgi:uncharacterized protein (DUF1499 family)
MAEMDDHDWTNAEVNTLTQNSHPPRTRPLWVLLVLLVIGCLMIAIGRVVSARTSPPTGVGVQQKVLRECPAESTNCHRREVAFTAFGNSPPNSDAAAMERIRTAVHAAEGDVQTSTDMYLHAIFYSQVFGFPDDFEVVIIKGKTMQFRSASRLGSGDFGVNRKRIDSIVAKLRQ